MTKNDVAIKQKKSNGLFLSIKKNWQLYLFILPALISIIVFKYAPLYGVQLAFRDFRAIDGIMGSEWVGLEHFIDFFNSRDFERVLGNTIILSLYEIALSFPIPIILALFMNQLRSKRYKNLLENIFYVPHFISVVVLVGLINTFFSYSSGFVNNIFEVFGIERYDYIGDPDAFRNLYVFSGIWKNTGWNMIIYIAALSGIDASLYEASTIDGASKFQKIIYIDIPSILPTIMMLFVLALGRTMSIGFEKAFLMQNQLNISTSEIIATYVYTVGLQRVQYDYATAIGLFNNVINAVMLIFANKLSKKVTNSGIW